MSYIKLSQIADVIVQQPFNLIGTVYLEDENGNILVNNNPVFPLNVTVEVISWHSIQDFQIHGKTDAFNVELLTIPSANSTAIRQYIFNQLSSKYPGLVE